MWPPQRLDEASSFAATLILGEINGFDGGRTQARTVDPLIKSQLLYQLSYAPIEVDAGLGRWGGG